MVGEQTNKPLQEALALYQGIEDDYLDMVRATGVEFAPRDEARAERTRLLRELRQAGARIRNGGASVVLGPMSPACVACTADCVSKTVLLTNNCHRDCYFCFNPNQEDFAYYCEHEFPWREELDTLYAQVSDGKSASPRAMALTGGEPLLYPDETCAFFARARELFPHVHLRLYTSGDLLDGSLAQRLGEAGLDEIRFSVKQEDTDAQRERVFAAMQVAKQFIPCLMVEMPVTPDSRELMHTLLRRFEALGVYAVNLLEFTYAFWNWPAFADRGYLLKNPPFDVLYDYEYAGSLAVQGSEELALELMLWAHEQGLHLGLHYCSLDNKHRSQIRLTNEPHAHDNPCYALDYADFFLKTGQVYGPDRAVARDMLRAKGCRTLIEDEDGNCTSFHPRWFPCLEGVTRDNGELLCPCVSYNVAVSAGTGIQLRELKVVPYAEAPAIQLRDQTALSDQAADAGEGWVR